VLLAASLSLCFLLAWAAALVGLAPIVGAFAAGLLLERAHYHDLEVREERHLHHLLEPIAGFLVPIFFVLMGVRVDLRAFADPGLLALAVALTLAAVAGKQLCSLGVLDRSIDRLFAGVGLRLQIGGEPVVDAATYGAVVVMVLVTTLLTPPALRWSLARRA
jgi:Na+:H+ antiporter